MERNPRLKERILCAVSLFVSLSLSYRTSVKERRKNETFVRWRNEEARDRESTERRDGEREITM